MKMDIAGWLIAWVLLCVFSVRIGLRLLDVKHPPCVPDSTASGSVEWNLIHVYYTDDKGDRISLYEKLI